MLYAAIKIAHLVRIDLHIVHQLSMITMQIQYLILQRKAIRDARPRDWVLAARKHNMQGCRMHLTTCTAQKLRSYALTCFWCLNLL